MVWWRRAPVSTHSEQRPQVRIPTPPTHNESGLAQRKLPRRSALRDWTHEAAGTNFRFRFTKKSEQRSRAMKGWFVPPIVIPILIAVSLVGYVSLSAWL